MAKRYLTRPRHIRSGDIDENLNAENYLSRSVYETDPTPYPTGLLDAFGEPLYATYELDPIGFIRFES